MRSEQMATDAEAADPHGEEALRAVSNHEAREVGVIPGRCVSIEPGIHCTIRMLGEMGSGLTLRVPRNDGAERSPRNAQKTRQPCHFGPLGLERRHVRGPRTPGGLPRT